MRFASLSLLALLAWAAPASASVVYDLPGSSIVYGHNFQNSNYRAAGSFQSDAAGSNLTSVTWYVRVDGNWAAINSGSNPLAAGTKIDLSLYSNGGSNQPGTLIGNLGSISLAGLGANQGMQPFSLTGISAPLAPSAAATRPTEPSSSGCTPMPRPRPSPATRSSRATTPMAPCCPPTAARLGPAVSPAASASSSPARSRSPRPPPRSRSSASPPRCSASSPCVADAEPLDQQAPALAAYVPAARRGFFVSRAGCYLALAPPGPPGFLRACL
jgi:hypothetical protein